MRDNLSREATANFYIKHLYDKAKTGFIYRSSVLGNCIERQQLR